MLAELFLKRLKNTLLYLVIPTAYPKSVRNSECIYKYYDGRQPMFCRQVKPREEDEKEKYAEI